MKMTLHSVAMVLLLVGGLNWGLVGIFDYNLVSALVGMGMVENLVYTLVGVSALYLAATHQQTCVLCGAMNGKKK